jgi:hypothetical protein
MNNSQLLQNLIDLKVAGEEVGHSRFLNIRNIKRLVKNEQYATFGVKNLGILNSDEVLKLVTKITGCSSDINFTEGPGYINPEATVEGLKEAAKVLSKLKKDSKVLMATGHPGSLIGFYQEIGSFLKSRCQIITAKEQIEVKRFRCPDCGTHDDIHWIDYIDDVAFVTDGDTSLHIHSPAPMVKLLEKTGKPDLVLADHGFVGEAINQNIPSITFMDTNDPVLAVAKENGAPLTIIPMDDNRGNIISKEVGKLLIGLIK